jgi:hypothetical protein
LATVRSGQWFFFANDVERLKVLLDRVEGRAKDPQTALSADDVFLGASNPMPASYAALCRNIEANGSGERPVRRRAAATRRSAVATSCSLQASLVFDLPELSGSCSPGGSPAAISAAMVRTDCSTLVSR